MEEIIKHLVELGSLTTQNLVNVIDILVVAYLIYRILSLVRGPRARRIIGGIVFFVFLLIVSSVANLVALHWLLEKATLLGPVALAILLLPELRQGLEGIGGSWAGWSNKPHAEMATIDEIIGAVRYLRAAQVGALMVIERGPPLDSITSNGVHIDAEVSAPLLESIFYEGNPLHDGAVIIRGDVIVAAACQLPLSSSPLLDSSFHMRHRAAVGVTEEMDCVCVVVSEERGSITIASDGHLKRISSELELREALIRELQVNGNPDRRSVFGLKLGKEVSDDARLP